MAKKAETIRPVEKVLNRYSEAHKHPKNVLLQWFSIPLLSFGILAIVWSIPFPHLNFLGKFNGFINWASFLIAFAIYYYYKLSPLLSYGALLMVFAFSAAVVSLEKIVINGIMALYPVSVIVLLLGVIIQLIAYRFEGQSPSVRDNFRFLLDGPIWLFARILGKAGAKV